jgi:thiamine-monophosphate kinase
VILRHFWLIAGQVGLYQPSRALKVASKKWADSREGLKNPPAPEFSVPRTLKQEGRTSQRPGRFLTYIIATTFHPSSFILHPSSFILHPSPALPGKLAELACRPSREIAVSLLNRHRAGGFDLTNYSTIIPQGKLVGFVATHKTCVRRSAGSTFVSIYGGINNRSLSSRDIKNSMEQSFVAWAKVRARKLPQVKLGIGDDAAILAADSADSVITTDSMMDGVHFRLEEAGPRRVGRKLVNVNLSDLAAMAAEPVAVFLSLCLPPSGPNGMPRDALAAELYEAICDECEKHGIAMAGGDTNCWDGPLVLHMTAVGRCVDGVVWTRAGAKPEDLIVVTGPLGGSLAGKHLDFSPRLDVVAQVRHSSAIHAAMDISDGLSVDLLRMCDASRCGAILELDKIPLSEAAVEAAKSGDKSPLEHALGDGEDFELLMAVDPAQFDQFSTQLEGVCQPVVCGTITSRTGLWSKTGSKIEQLSSSGYVHGR